MSVLPDYYSSLAPFRAVFGAGTPVLTYHHVGPRPARARIKGLYVSPRLFARQLNELQAAGFSAPDYASVMEAPRVPQDRVLLTFDDGFPDVLRHALPVMQRLGWRGIQFLVADLLGQANRWEQEHSCPERLMDEAEIRDWLAAGQRIGSHTRTHPFLTRLSVEAAREEISASKKSLEDRFGVAIEHFCYPYGDWNDRVRDLVIDAGYRTACTTRSGVNTAATSPFELRRFTARYASRNLKAIWSRLRGVS